MCYFLVENSSQSDSEVPVPVKKLPRVVKPLKGKTQGNASAKTRTVTQKKRQETPTPFKITPAKNMLTDGGESADNLVSSKFYINVAFDFISHVYVC
jgi:hypothetical protein